MRETNWSSENFSKYNLQLIPPILVRNLLSLIKIIILSAIWRGLCFSTIKPFTLSKPLARIFKTYGFEQTLKKVGLDKKDLVFDFDKKSLFKMPKKTDLEKLAKFSRAMRGKRNYENLSLKYANLLSRERKSLAVNAGLFSPPLPVKMKANG